MSAVVDLLKATGVVEFYYCDVGRVIEIAGRIIEGDVTVLANTEQCDIEAFFGQQCRIAVALFVPVFRFAAKLVENGGFDVVEDMLAEKAAEGVRCVWGGTGVFIEMVCGDPSPVDSRLGDQGGQRLVL